MKFSQETQVKNLIHHWGLWLWSTHQDIVYFISPMRCYILLWDFIMVLSLNLAYFCLFIQNSGIVVCTCTFGKGLYCLKRRDLQNLYWKTLKLCFTTVKEKQLPKWFEILFVSSWVDSGHLICPLNSLPSGIKLFIVIFILLLIPGIEAEMPLVQFVFTYHLGFPISDTISFLLLSYLFLSDCYCGERLINCVNQSEG